MNSRKFLYEHLEDYYNTKDENVRQYIFNKFVRRLKKSLKAMPESIVGDRCVEFNINRALTPNLVADTLKPYSKVSYVGIQKSYRCDDAFEEVAYNIRKLYHKYCDADYCDHPSYMKLLSVPKDWYYMAIDSKIVNDAFIKRMREALAQNQQNIKEFKEKWGKSRLFVSFSQFFKLILTFLRRIFDNFTPLKIAKKAENLAMGITDAWHDDFYASNYMRKSIAGYIINEWRRANGTTKLYKGWVLCKKCGTPMNKKSNNHKYCSKCKNEKMVV